MNIVRTVSIFLCGVPLLGLGISGASMINYVQQDVRLLATEHLLKNPFLCEISIHEAGYARIAIGLIGLVLLTIPFRKGDRSSWVALAIIFLYQIPAFLLLSPSWRDLRETPHLPGLHQALLLNLVLPVMYFLGLAVSLPGFLQTRRVDKPSS
jgi:hypothetical protein